MGDAVRAQGIVTGGDVIRRELNLRIGGADITLPGHSAAGYVIGETIEVEYHHRRGWKITRTKPEKKTTVRLAGTFAKGFTQVNP